MNPFVQTCSKMVSDKHSTRDWPAHMLKATMRTCRHYLHRLPAWASIHRASYGAISWADMVHEAPTPFRLVVDVERSVVRTEIEINGERLGKTRGNSSLRQKDYDEICLRDAGCAYAEPQTRRFPLQSTHRGLRSHSHSSKHVAKSSRR